VSRWVEHQRFDFAEGLGGFGELAHVHFVQRHGAAARGRRQSWGSGACRASGGGGGGCCGVGAVAQEGQKVEAQMRLEGAQLAAGHLDSQHALQQARRLNKIGHSRV
jgi:hypothetical protein